MYWPSWPSVHTPRDDGVTVRRGSSAVKKKPSWPYKTDYHYGLRINAVTNKQTSQPSCRGSWWGRCWPRCRWRPCAHRAARKTPAWQRRRSRPGSRPGTWTRPSRTPAAPRYSHTWGHTQEAAEAYNTTLAKTMWDTLADCHASNTWTRPSRTPGTHQRGGWGVQYNPGQTMWDTLTDCHASTIIWIFKHENSRWKYFCRWYSRTAFPSVKFVPFAKTETAIHSLARLVEVLSYREYCQQTGWSVGLYCSRNVQHRWIEISRMLV